MSHRLIPSLWPFCRAHVPTTLDGTCLRIVRVVLQLSRSPVLRSPPRASRRRSPLNPLAKSLPLVPNIVPLVPVAAKYPRHPPTRALTVVILGTHPLRNVTIRVACLPQPSSPILESSTLSCLVRPAK